MTGACARCGRVGEAAPTLPRPPLPGAFGRLVQQQVCADCWQEWTRSEVMVINELRLNFMDPASQVVLDRHLREFLHLPVNPENPQPPDEPAGDPGDPADSGSSSGS